MLGSYKPNALVLLAAPVTDQNFHRMKLLQVQKYFRVTVVDLSSYLGRTGHSNTSETWPEIIRVQTLAEFELTLQQSSSRIAFDHIGISHKSFEISRLLRKFRVLEVVHRLGVQPSPPFLTRIGRLARLVLFTGRTDSPSLPSSTDGPTPNSFRIGVWMAVAPTLNRLVGLVFPPFASFHGGRKSIDAYTLRSRKKFWVGSDDYQTWKSSKVVGSSEQRGSSRPFALFIDDAVAFADDWRVLGLEAPVTGCEYARQICESLTKFESDTGLPVVIAGHPNMQFRENYSAIFGGRETHFNSTVKLVRSASAVLTHASTAISFAVLDEKPIYLLGSIELLDSHYGPSILALARSLRLPIYSEGVSVRPFVIRDVYASQRLAKYRRNFLCGVSESQTQSWADALDVLANYVKSEWKPKSYEVLNLDRESP